MVVSTGEIPQALGPVRGGRVLLDFGFTGGGLVLFGLVLGVRTLGAFPA